MATATRYKRVRILLLMDRTDEHPMEPFGFEIPVLQAIWGREKLKYLEEGEESELTRTIQDLWEGLRKGYGRENMEQAYGDEGGFRVAVGRNDALIEELAAPEQARKRSEAAMDTPHQSEEYRVSSSLRDRLRSEAGRHLHWLVGGDGDPYTTEQDAAARTIRHELAKGLLAIARARGHTAKGQALETALVAVRAVNLDTVGPTIHERGDSNALPGGGPGKMVHAATRTGSGPLDANTFDAYTDGKPDDPCDFEQVRVSHPGLMSWRREAATRGSARVVMVWIDQESDENVPVHVKLEARNQAGAVRRAVQIPVPRQGSSEPAGAG